ncbi:MAG: tetratricopeptide repeat protein [Albidovulum sp.]
MSVRKILLASVCSAFLAASAAASGAAAANPDSKLVSQAYKALQVGDAEAAVRAYTKAIESRNLEPEVLANALLNRGLAYQRINEHDRDRRLHGGTAHRRHVGKAQGPGALQSRTVLSAERNNAQAVEDFTSALFLDSQFSHAYYSRGVLLRDGGQHLFALADFDKALRFKYPDPARVYFAESLTFEKLRRTSDARDALNKAIAANPKYEPALQRLALLDGKQLPQAASDPIRS